MWKEWEMKNWQTRMPRKWREKEAMKRERCESDVRREKRKKDDGYSNHANLTPDYKNTKGYSIKNNNSLCHITTFSVISSN